jgi:LmbE family N-acetylglucosaminyl deacetylase
MKNALIIVAHPDDESLWFGGTLLKFSGMGIKPLIVCLTNKNHAERSKEFYSACKYLGAKGVMLDYQDGGLARFPLFPVFSKDLKKILKENFGDGKIDLIISHSSHGEEHGHKQHKQVFFLAGRFARQNKIPFAFFSDKKINYDMGWKDWLHNPRLANSMRKIKYEIISKIDLAKKQALLDLFSSQISGLRQYQTFNKNEEYLYTEEDIKFT